MYVRITPPMFDRTQIYYTVVGDFKLYAAAYDGITFDMSNGSNTRK